MKNPHFKLNGFVGPKSLNLLSFSISDELSEAISNKDILKALRLGIGVDEFNLLQNGSQLGNTQKLLLNYA